MLTALHKTTTVDTKEAGRKGGLATAKKRSKKERSEAARHAAKARWEASYFNRSLDNTITECNKHWPKGMDLKKLTKGK